MSSGDSQSTQHQSVEIRLIEDGDVEDLAVALGPDVSKRQIENRWLEHRQGHRQTLVAVVNGRPVGTISFGGARHRLPDSLRMFALDVGASFRRRGIGTKLVRATEEVARKLKHNKVNLEVAFENDGAIVLYEGLCYTVSGGPVMDRWRELTDGGESHEVESLCRRMTKEMLD